MIISIEVGFQPNPTRTICDFGSVKKPRAVSYKRFALTLASRLVKEKGLEDSIANRNFELSIAYRLIESDPAINIEAKEWAKQRAVGKYVSAKKLRALNSKNVDLTMKGVVKGGDSAIFILFSGKRISIDYRGASAETIKILFKSCRLNLKKALESIVRLRTVQSVLELAIPSILNCFPH